MEDGGVDGDLGVGGLDDWGYMIWDFGLICYDVVDVVFGVVVDDVGIG